MKQCLNFFLVVVLLCALANDSFAQAVDSVKLALKNAKHDTTRCNILAAMIEAEGDDAVWPKYNEEIKVICEKELQECKILNPVCVAFKKHYAAVLNNIGYLHLQQGKSAVALKYYEQSLKLQQEINNKSGEAAALNNIGGIYDDQGDALKALEYITQSLKVREQIQDKKGMASSLLNIGTIHKNQGNMFKALDYYTRSLKIREEIQDKQGMSYCLNNIGLIYKNQDDFTKALEYYLKSLEIQKQIQDKNGIAQSLNNIGQIYQQQEKIPEALDTYQKSLKTFQELQNKRGVASCLNNIGSIYLLKKDYSAALNCYLQSLKIFEEIQNKNGIAQALNYIGAVYLKQGKPDKALIYCEKSLELSKTLGYPQNIRNTAKNLNAIYKAKGNYKNALESYELFVLMRDSINNESTRKASIKSQFKYEYEKKAAADSVRVAEEQKIVAVQLKQEKTQRFALYGGLLLVIVFAGFMFNRFRVTNKQKQIIELKEKETQQQNVIITQQKHLVEEKHKEITDSINYAERIQRSFLASKELLDANLNRNVTSSADEGGVSRSDTDNYFIFFKPKDVVSGDFYWAASVGSKQNSVDSKEQKQPTADGQLFYFAVADSTGHGVPGAIMSLLNITSLEKALEHHTDPADILNHTRQTIIQRLKKDGSAEGGKDGMDCSLLCFDFNTNQLQLAAAHNPVWIVRTLINCEQAIDNSKENYSLMANGYCLLEIKGDKMPVGKHDKDQEPFTLHTIQLQKGDLIYTLTDGFSDQFGGISGKKFMSKNLKQLLMNNAHLPMEAQKQVLETSLKNWTGALEQVDDICIVGIRV